MSFRRHGSERSPGRADRPQGDEGSSLPPHTSGPPGGMAQAHFVNNASLVEDAGQGVRRKFRAGIEVWHGEPGAVGGHRIKVFSGVTALLSLSCPRRPLAPCPVPGEQPLLHTVTAEWAGGIAPPASHRSGRESLPSSGSCYPWKAAAFGRARRAPPVAGWPWGLRRVTCARRSAGITPCQRYYGAVRPSPVHRYVQPHGSTAWAFSLRITGEVLTFRPGAQIGVTPPIHRTPHGQ
jgi:hypothetical protein